MKDTPKHLGCRVVEGNMFLRCADCGRMISGRDYAVGEETTQECPTRWKSLAEQLDGTVRAGHALYDAIVRLLAPHFPPGSRDLDWDVLPGTLAALARERDELRLTLAAEQGRPEGAPYDNPELVLAMVNGERIRRGLSWRELAAILGVSPSTLTRWTHGKMLSVPAYLLVCKWLNAAINETIDIVDANGPGWCDRCSPDRCDCEDDDTARAAMLAADGGEP